MTEQAAAKVAAAFGRTAPLKATAGEELDAMQAAFKALEPLDRGAQARAIRWLRARFGA